MTHPAAQPSLASAVEVRDPWLVRACERGWLPDAWIRAGMRTLIRQRLRDEHAGDDVQCTERLEVLLRELRASPIAIETLAANAQHYEVPGAFFEAHLGPRLKYSCGFYANGNETLAQAEDAMLALYTQRAGIVDGQRILDLGCGWGGFALHAARQGIHVHALTISEQQHALATERVARENLDDRVDVDLRDYRDIEGQYDAIVSIEMFEAVGQAFWPTYFDTVKRHLAPGAQALIQTITIDESHFFAYSTSSDFIREYIFPGGMLASPERFVRAARVAGLHAEVSLSFGLDYARTVRHWHAAFEAHLDKVRAQGFDDTFIRTWRLYLKFCEAGFVERRTDVMHFVLADANRD